MGLTNEMEKRICEALRRVWDYTGDDILGGDERTSVSRDIVFEVCADRLEPFGHDQKAAEVFYALSRKEQQAIKHRAFPCDTYGY